MSEKPKISVIVPIYNTENYLEQCLRSIMEQSFRDIEILCVDDCSTDGSAALVERLASEDARIRLLRHTTNTGGGGARNTGIRAAKGDYIASVDSDDYIDPHMLETMWRATLDQSVDVVVCGFNKVNTHGDILRQYVFASRLIDNRNNDFNIFSWGHPVFWNKLWRTNLFIDNAIEFPHQRFCHDVATIPRLMHFSKKIHYINDILCYYRIYDGSLVRSFSIEHISSIIGVYTILYKFSIKYNIYDCYHKYFWKRFEGDLIFRASQLNDLDYDDKIKIQYLRHALLVKYGLNELSDTHENFLSMNQDDLRNALLSRSLLQTYKNAAIRRTLPYTLCKWLFFPFLGVKQKMCLKQDPMTFFRTKKTLLLFLYKLIFRKSPVYALLFKKGESKHA